MESRWLAVVEIQLTAARGQRDVWVVKHLTCMTYTSKCTTALSEPLDGGKECHYSLAI